MRLQWPSYSWVFRFQCSLYCSDLSLLPALFSLTSWLWFVYRELHHLCIGMNYFRTPWFSLSYYWFFLSYYWFSLLLLVFALLLLIFSLLLLILALPLLIIALLLLILALLLLLFALLLLFTHSRQLSLGLWLGIWGWMLLMTSRGITELRILPPASSRPKPGTVTLQTTAQTNSRLSGLGL